MAHSKQRYLEIATEIATQAVASAVAQYGEFSFDAPNPDNKGYFDRVLKARVGNEQLGITALRVQIIEAITEGTYEYSKEIDAEEDAEWSAYERNRPDSMSAGDLL